MLKKLLLVMLSVVLLIGLAIPTAVMAGSESDPDEFPLYAGQDIEVGKVQVWNDSNGVCAKFAITESDWVITEVHLAIEASMEAIPQTGYNKKGKGGGNPIPGQFEFIEEFDLGVTEAGPYCKSWEDLGADCGDEIYIAAHAVVQKCTLNAEAPYNAMAVIDYEQGLRYDETAVRTQRSNPDAVLTYNSASSSEADFFSLGFGGWVVVEFEYPILNGDGNDLQVIEDTWGLPYPNESADVYAKENEADPWILLGPADNQAPVNSWHTVTDLDLGSLASAKFIKIVDTSSRTDFDTYVASHGSDTVDGYDLNAIVSLQDNVTCQIETAWGGEEDFPGANWATYIVYQPECEVEFPEGGTVTIAFEDLPLDKTLDWDYNDWVADIDTVLLMQGDDLKQANFTITPEARGAGYNHVFHLEIPADTFGGNGDYKLTIYVDGVPNETNSEFDASVDNDFIVIPDTTAALPGTLTNTIEPTGIVSHYPTIGNTDPAAPQHQTYVPTTVTATLEIVFDAPYASFDVSSYDPYNPANAHGEGLFFNPYLHVNNTGEDIDVGDVRMLTVPDDWMWPEAGIGVWLAYPAVDLGNPPLFSEDWWTNYVDDSTETTDDDLVYNGNP
ncbi:MAG: hypothetical protein PHU23_14590 [Dehalococcoidales bacterium]|nr:hypothetical protein [Dehalococcoidales bacterium]